MFSRFQSRLLLTGSASHSNWPMWPARWADTSPHPPSLLYFRLFPPCSPKALSRSLSRSLSRHLTLPQNFVIPWVTLFCQTRNSWSQWPKWQLTPKFWRFKTLLLTFPDLILLTLKLCRSWAQRLEFLSAISVQDLAAALNHSTHLKTWPVGSPLAEVRYTDTIKIPMKTETAWKWRR